MKSFQHQEPQKLRIEIPFITRNVFFLYVRTCLRFLCGYGSMMSLFTAYWSGFQELQNEVAHIQLLARNY